MTDAHETGYFTEGNSAEVVTARNANARDARLREVMEVITRHLHAAIKEIEPSQDEWMQAIQFLTRTGQKCDDWRQEYIRLANSSLQQHRWCSRKTGTGSFGRLLPGKTTGRFSTYNNTHQSAQSGGLGDYAFCSYAEASRIAYALVPYQPTCTGKSN